LLFFRLPSAATFAQTTHGDLVEAVGGGVGGAHAASLAGPLFQFQGRSSASRAAG
jgi:hypothetical protein